MKVHNKLLSQRTDIHHHVLLSWVWCIHFMLYHPVSLKSSWKLFSQLCLSLHIRPFPSGFSFPRQTRVCVHFSAVHATCQLTLVMFVRLFLISNLYTSTLPKGLCGLWKGETYLHTSVLKVFYIKGHQFGDNITYKSYFTNLVPSGLKPTFPKWHILLCLWS